LYLNQGKNWSNFISYSFSIYRNLDWLYSTPAGRQQIISSAKYTTIAFIYLQSDEEYRDLDQVKSEMTDAVLDFKPMNLPDNVQVEMRKKNKWIKIDDWIF
jgi:hypothetical protein